MLQIGWNVLRTCMESQDEGACLCAEIGERLRLGQEVVVTGVPPEGASRTFREPDEFAAWFDAVRADAPG